MCIRDRTKVVDILSELSLAAKEKNKNLLALSIKAAKARATLGEISTALEKEFGRYKSEVKSFSGVYKSNMKDNSSYLNAVDLSNKFAEIDGRRPRILIAKIGQDGHDRGAKIIASSFADLGFDVDIGPLFQTPNEAAKQAIENDVHIIGVSSLAAGHKTLLPILMEELKKKNANSIKVICGGVIPPDDYDFLKKLGVSEVFGPGTNIPKAAIEIVRLIWYF